MGWLHLNSILRILCTFSETKAGEFHHLDVQKRTPFQIKLGSRYSTMLGLAIVRTDSSRKNNIIDAIDVAGQNCPFTATISGRAGTHVKFNLDNVVHAYGMILQLMDEQLIDIEFHMISTHGASGKGSDSWKHWKLLLIPLHSMDDFISKHFLSLRAQIDIQVHMKMFSHFSAKDIYYF